MNCSRLHGPQKFDTVSHRRLKNGLTSHSLNSSRGVSRACWQLQSSKPSGSDDGWVGERIEYKDGPTDIAFIALCRQDYVVIYFSCTVRAMRVRGRAVKNAECAWTSLEARA